MTPRASPRPAMAVRVARVDDAEAISRVHVESSQHAYREILPAEYLARLSVEQRRVMWTEAITNDRPTVLVAEEGGSVAGFCAVGPCRDKSAAATDQEIWAIYVSPHAWTRGLGRHLWRASRELAVGRGAARISLWVIANNARAIRFYEAVGLQAEAGSLQPFQLGGVTLQEIRYVHHLEREDERPV